MLTVEKLKTYQRFDGNIDGWAISARVEGNPAQMTDDDWFLIDELRQGLALVAAGRASTTFRSSIEAKLFESTTDDQTRELLRQLVSQNQRKNDAA